MTFHDFIRDKDGNVVVGQPPNILISVWVVLKALDFFVFHGDQPSVTMLATAVLFAWAYDEIRRGDSLFRRVLGGVVMLYIVVSLFV